MRVAMNLSQAELADQAGVSRQTIVSIEKQTGLPRLRTAKAIAGVLRCDASDLFNNLGQEPGK